MMSLFRAPKIGLALGSGGGKGLAHIGVIKALEAEGIPIHAIAGSSIGAIVGALYAVRRDITSVERLALTTNWNHLAGLLDIGAGNGGLLQGKKLEYFLSSALEVDTFEELSMPLAAVATDMHSGEPHVFRSGSVIKALRASAGVPLLFRPLETPEGWFSDGGLSLPVPVRVAHELGADVVIAVDLDADSCTYDKPIRSLLQMTDRTISLLSVHLAREQVIGADVHIKPRVGDLGWSAFLTTEGTRDAILRGEEAAQKHIEDIRRATTHPVLWHIRKVLG